MYLRFLSFATLLAALVFVSFRWYQTSTALEGCGQYLQGAQRLLTFCIPVVEYNNYAIFQEAMMPLSVYRSDISEKLMHQFRRLDTLHQISVDSCVRTTASSLPTVVSVYADSVLAYVERDSLTKVLLKKVLQDFPLRADYPDTLLRQQATLQLGLLQGIGFNYLASRIGFCGVIRPVKNRPILVPRQIEAKLGQPFDAQLLLTNQIPVNYCSVDVTVNGQPYRLINREGEFKTTFQKPGVHQLSLKSTTTHAFTGEISVSSHTVEVLVRGE